MFRLVADIIELNIDQVKLPKIPGLGMLMKLPNKQKISMIVSVLNAQKGQFLPKWQEAVNQKWGQLQLLDYQVEQPGDGSCLARIRIDVGNADYDKAIDSVIPHVFQEKDAHTVLGGDYAGSGNLQEVMQFMHNAPTAAKKEFYIVKTLSVEKETIASVSVARKSVPFTSASASSAISSFRRAGSTASPITSMRPMFSFLI